MVRTHAAHNTGKETMTAFAKETANILENGALELDRYNAPDQTGVVLAFHEQSPHPYVTWLVDRDGSTYAGHYHSDVVPALADFNKRLVRARSAFED